MMYNVKKEVIIIKRKDLIFILSFILFILVGSGVFLYVENNSFEAMIIFVIAFLFMMVIISITFKNTSMNSTSFENQDILEENKNVETLTLKQKFIPFETDFIKDEIIFKKDFLKNKNQPEMNFNTSQSVSINKQSFKQKEHTLFDKTNLNTPNLETIQNENFFKKKEDYDLQVNHVNDFITVKMSQIHFENLNSLIDQLEQARMIQDNNSFLLNDQIEKKVFAKIFPNLPIVNLVKNKKLNYKVLGGLDGKRVYELGEIEEADLTYVQETFPKTKNLVAMIEGGKMKDFNTEPPSQKFLPYRIKLKFYQ